MEENEQLGGEIIMERESGYYWVLPKENKWIIATWIASLKVWLLNSNVMIDSDFKEIDERQITRDNTKVGQEQVNG